MSKLEQEFVQLMKDFPEVKCLCEFPIFDNGRHRHSTTCPKMLSARKLQGFPKTDYQATYDKKVQRPRSNKRPPPTPRDPCPPQMDLHSYQRQEFIDHGDYQQRPAAYKIEEKYQSPAIPVESKTWYNAEFTEKPFCQVTSKAPKDVSRFSRHATFHTTTTNKEHYKPYQSDKAFAFQELPSFTGSILYPGQQRQHETTNQAVFKGEFIRRPDAFDPIEDSQKLQGKQDFQTTHREVYTSKKSQRPPAFNAQPQMGRFHRGNFQKQTQSMTDFKHWAGVHRPPAAEPAPETINLKFNNRTSFDTEQRQQFKGIDTRVHTMPRSKKVEEEYKVPEIKFETQTNQKLDYKEHDLKEALVPRAAGPPGAPKQRGTFDGRTTNKTHYPAYKAANRLRHGDFHEAQKYGFVAPVARFKGESTTQSTFVPKKGEKREPFVPEESSMGRDGQQIFDTEYGVTFKGAQPKFEKSQVYLLRQELLRRRHAAAQKQLQQQAVA